MLKYFYANVLEIALTKIINLISSVWWHGRRDSTGKPRGRWGLLSLHNFHFGTSVK
jgi:hypothetical protein